MMAFLGMALCWPARAQDLLTDALGSFPADTLRVEYSSAAKLRRLPNYSALRQRYLGPRLAKLEEALRQLGVNEEDVDELVAGWRAGTKEQPAKEQMDLFGLAAGRFDAARMAREAAAHGVARTPLRSQPAAAGQPAGAGQPGYCIQVESLPTCAVLFGESRGAFGPRALVGSIVESRENPDAPTLRTAKRFADLVREAQTDAPIWGAATGAAIPDTVQSWLPGQENLQLNWPSLFKDVWGLTYGLQVADKVELRATFNCTTDEATLNLRQVLEGLRLFQQIAWQNKNASQPNPFSALEINTQGQKVQLQLTWSLAALGLPAHAATTQPSKTP